MLAYRIDHYLFPAAVLRVRLLQVTNFETYKKAKAAEFHWCLGKNWIVGVAQMRALNIAAPDVAAPSKNKNVTALRSNSLKQFTGLMYLRF